MLMQKLTAFGKLASRSMSCQKTSPGCGEKHACMTLPATASVFTTPEVIVAFLRGELAVMSPNNAFERSVKPRRRRAPRAPGYIVRPRRAAAVTARPLNASVRPPGAVTAWIDGRGIN